MLLDIEGAYPHESMLLNYQFRRNSRAGINFAPMLPGNDLR